jgi:protein SCO1/2
MSSQQPASTAPAVSQEKRRQLLIAMLGATAIGLALLMGVLLFLRPGSADTYIGTPLDPPLDTPAFTLQDQDGRTVQWSDYRGKPVVLTFLYTSCRTICPLTAHKISQVYAKLGEQAKDVAFVAITVDPERDTAEAVQTFSEKWSMAGRWDYLTGSTDNLAPLWRDYFVGQVRQEAIADAADPSRPSNGAYAVDHTSPIHVIDAQGRGRLAYSSAYTADEMAHDVRLLLAES